MRNRHRGQLIAYVGRFFVVLRGSDLAPADAMEPILRASWLQPSSGPATGSIEGRRAPRLEVTGQIQGQILGLDAPIIVCEISVDGFRIVTSVKLEVDAIHELRFALQDGSAVFTRARVIHQYEIGRGEGGTPLHATGFAFVDDTWRGRPTTMLIDHVMSTLAFDLG